jgi:hypothetical protein
VFKDDQTFVRSARNAGKRGFAGMRSWMPCTLCLSAHVEAQVVIEKLFTRFLGLSLTCPPRR